MSITPLNYHAPEFLPPSLTMPELRENSVLFNLYREKGADFCDKNGNTLLHLAVMMNDGVWVSFLVTLGLDPSAQNVLGNTPLHCAAETNNSILIQTLADKIQSLRNSLDLPNHQGFSALQVAILNNALLALDALTGKGADVNFENPITHSTAFTLAIENNLADAVEMLLFLGASSNTQDPLGNTPLHIVAKTGNREIAELLLFYKARICKNLAGDSPVHITAIHGQSDLLALFAEKGMSLEEPNAIGMPPIHLAMLYGKDDCCELLLDLNIDFSHKAIGNLSLLHLAVLMKSRLLERIAILSEEDINLPGPNGLTPLHKAVLNNNAKAVDILISQGADMRFICKDNLSPVDRAAMNGNIAIIKMMAKHDPSVLHERSADGTSPYIKAFEKGHKALLSYLPSDEYSRLYVAIKELGQVAGISGTIVHEAGSYSIESSQHYPYYSLCAEAIPEEFSELKAEFESASDIYRESSDILTSIRDGKTTVMPSGWKRHSICIVIQNNIMIICNRGMRRAGTSSFKTFIIDPTKITSEQIHFITHKNIKLSTEEGLRFFYEQLPAILSPIGRSIDSSNTLFCAAIETIAPKDQHMGNCCAASAKAAVRAAFILSILHKKGDCSSFDDLLHAKKLSKEVSTEIRKGAEARCTAVSAVFPRCHSIVQPVVCISKVKRSIRALTHSNLSLDYYLDILRAH